MPATVAALVVVATAPVDQGFITLKPMPLPIASRISDRPAETAAPARMADQDTAEPGADSFSTMTVSTMGRCSFSSAITGKGRRRSGQKCGGPAVSASVRRVLRRSRPAPVGAQRRVLAHEQQVDLRGGAVERP